MTGARAQHALRPAAPWLGKTAASRRDLGDDVGQTVAGRPGLVHAVAGALDGPDVLTVVPGLVELKHPFLVSDVREREPPNQPAVAGTRRSTG